MMARHCRASNRGHRGRAIASRMPAPKATRTNTVPAGLEHLTPRQIEVLRLVARGMSNNEIAETLFLSRRTVHAHLRSIFHKLGVGHRSAATRYAVQHGLL